MIATSDALRELGEAALHVVGQPRLVGTLDDRRERAVDVERQQRLGCEHGVEARDAFAAKTRRSTDLHRLLAVLVDALDDALALAQPARIEQHRARPAVDVVLLHQPRMLRMRTRCSSGGMRSARSSASAHWST